MVPTTMSCLLDRWTVCSTDQVRHTVALGLADGHDSTALATLEQYAGMRSLPQLKVDLVVQR